MSFYKIIFKPLTFALVFSRHEKKKKKRMVLVLNLALKPI